MPQRMTAARMLGSKGLESFGSCLGLNETVDRDSVTMTIVAVLGSLSVLFLCSTKPKARVVESLGGSK